MESVELKQDLLALSSEIGSGVSLLLQAATLAAEAGREIWDFALEISSLHLAGISNGDLRWMICKGYVQHAHEVTEPLEITRRFRASNVLTFSNRSCFVLTTKGRRFASQIPPPVTAQPSGIRNHPEANGMIMAPGRVSDAEIPLQVVSPTWDSGRHQLRVADVIVKEFSLPSPNQETILSAFEEENWPPCITDPLPIHPDLSAKRRLHNTIKSLNRNQKASLIRFMGDGTGEGVRWEWARRQGWPGESAVIGDQFARGAISTAPGIEKQRSSNSSLLLDTSRVDARRQAGAWTPQNDDRRCQLIDKEIQGTLTPGERLELAKLQMEAMDYLDLLAPPPIAGAWKLYDELLKKQQQQERE